jgi:hypothetical protein
VGTSLVIASSPSLSAQELRPIAITDSGGEVAFETIYQNDVQEGETTKQEFEEILMKETVSYWSKGYIYHPNFFEFDIGLTFGLSQEQERGTFQDDDNAEFIGYDVHLAIEKPHPYGVDLFALKDQRLVDQRFARNSIVDITTYKAIWDTDNSFLPTSIQLSSLTREEKGLFDRKDEENRVTVNSLHRAGDFSRTRINYSFRDYTSEQESTTTDVQSHTVFVTNTLNLDHEGSKKLNTTGRYYTDDGVTETNQASLFSNLTWDHTPNFQTFYSVDLNDSSTSFSDGGTGETIDTSSHNEQIGLRHKLYENLDTTFSLDNYRSKSDDFEQQEYGGKIDFHYVRPIPVGRVRANFGYSLHMTDQSSEGAVLAVIDEQHAWAVGFFFELDNTDVDTASIIVKRPDDIPLTEGLDYDLITIGNITRVIMLSNINIADGEQVRVDYLYAPAGDLEYDTIEYRAGTGLDLFDKFTISYSFLSVSQELQEGDPEESSLQDITDHRVDARYLIDLPRGFSSELSAFYENRDATFSPRESYGIKDRLAYPLWKNSEGDFSISYARSVFPDTDDETAVLILTNTIISRLNLNSQIIFNSLYRDVTGDVDERTEYELSLILQSAFRLITLSAGFSYENIEELRQDREAILLYLRLARKF